MNRNIRTIWKVSLLFSVLLGSSITLRGQTSTTSCLPFNSLFDRSGPPNGSPTSPFGPLITSFVSSNNQSVELGSYNLGTNLTLFTGVNTVTISGTFTVTASITAGALPPGLSLSLPSCAYPANGISATDPLSIELLTGTPNTVGSFTFTITLSYCGSSGCSSGPEDSIQYHMVVLPRFSQGSTPWASITYDDYNNQACQSGALGKNCFFGNSGCAVTAMAMLLSGEGLYLPPIPPDVPYITPSILNKLATIANTFEYSKKFGHILSAR